jgi:pimeloyl-ACP methyl ester carboxylesterase
VYDDPRHSPDDTEAARTNEPGNVLSHTESLPQATSTELLFVSNTALVLSLLPVASALAALAGFLVYACIRYSPVIGRIFEERPMFLPLRLNAAPGGEDVRFRTEDGLELAGTYYRAQSASRVGVMVFCHEYLGDRWSFEPYANGLRALGYDIFTFDFRNHGGSQGDPKYRPLQWATDHEVNDLRAALAFLRSRDDHDSAGFGLFGVSRGGSTALLVAAQDPGVWGVITDGAFPTRGTMLSYILRWAEIYVSNPYLWKSMPLWIFRLMAWTARVRSERRLNCRFPDVEKAVARLAPRAWLMIHGEKDAYIGTDIARTLFAYAGEPKEMWVVPKAKHNRCLGVSPAAYAERVTNYLRQYAPRRELSATVREPEVVHFPESRMLESDGSMSARSLAGELATPLSG